MSIHGNEASLNSLSKRLPMITISIVSHLQGDLLRALLGDLDRCCKTYPLEVILTLNLPEVLPFDQNGFSFPIIVHENQNRKGFSANHNQAFTYASGQFFCILNPDIRLESDPFQVLHPCLKDTSIGIAAPLVIGENGKMEDSARHFPTPFKILCKAFGGCKGGDYVVKDELVFPDWLGGMFMLFRREVYAELGGFNERYFLYYEDVDLCARLRLSGYEVALCPAAKVVHHAHRSSHRSLRYFCWHLTSMMRFFLSSVYWRVQCRKWL